MVWPDWYPPVRRIHVKLPERGRVSALRREHAGALNEEIGGVVREFLRWSTATFCAARSFVITRSDFARAICGGTLLNGEPRSEIAAIQDALIDFNRTCHPPQCRIGLRELKQPLRMGAFAQRRDQSSVAFASRSLEIAQRLKGRKFLRCAQTTRGELPYQRAASPKKVWRLTVCKMRGASKLLQNLP